MKSPTLTRLLTLSAAAATAVVLAACGSQDETQADSQSMAEMFGLPDYSDPDLQSTYEDEQRLVEEAIAECMIDKGFEYEPVLYDTGLGVSEFTDVDAIEQARQYGLGVALQYNNPEYDEAMDVGADEFVDPNQEYLESFSEAEMQAYYEALDGTEEEQAEYMTEEVDPESGETYQIMSGAGAGCRGDAQRAVGSDMGDSRVYEAMEPFQTELYERVDADTRVVEAKAAWSACMSDKGFEYETEEDVYTYASGPMTERLTEILGADPYGDPFADMSPEEQEAFFTEKTQAEIDEYYESYQDRLLENADLEALKVLQEEERNLAVASAECSQGQYEVYEEVYKDLEAAYMTENADRIAAAVAELENAPAPSSS